MIFNQAIITQSGSNEPVSPTEPLDPVEVYRNTRPTDWLPMPKPNDDEMYLLFHIPDGFSSLLAFTVTCTGEYTVELGTVIGGAFVPSFSTSIQSGSKYETELFSDDYGDLTSDGVKQAMVKVSGSSILTWVPSTHSKKTSPSDFSGWNIMEISCKLPFGTTVRVGNGTSNLALRKLKYFTWDGENACTNMYSMFNNCSSLIAVPNLDTQNVTDMSSMFSYCHSLMAAPSMDTKQVTSMYSMFKDCYSLMAAPNMDTHNVNNMRFMFNMCFSLISVQSLDMRKVTEMGYMFNACVSLMVVQNLDIQEATSMGYMFSACNSLTSVLITSSVTGWSGVAISLGNCSMTHDAIILFFNNLPEITAAKAITLTGNPGVSELTDAEKAIATQKGWTLTI